MALVGGALCNIGKNWKLRLLRHPFFFKSFIVIDFTIVYKFAHPKSKP
jgi:hypothetical protein